MLGITDDQVTFHNGNAKEYSVSPNIVIWEDILNKNTTGSYRVESVKLLNFGNEK